MRIVIVDDDRFVTASLKTILESEPDMEAAGVGNTGEQAVELYRKLKPDILLIDIRMEGMTGIEAAQQVISEDVHARILFLTTFSDDEYIIKALRLGAKGYILKQDVDSIVPSLRTVYSGQRVFGDAVVTRLPALMEGVSRRGMEGLGLSAREIEMISRVADGLSNREISETMYLSEGTVRNYISSILEKLNLRDRTQLAVFYYKHFGNTGHGLG